MISNFDFQFYKWAFLGEKQVHFKGLLAKQHTGTQQYANQKRKNVCLKTYAWTSLDPPISRQQKGKHTQALEQGQNNFTIANSKNTHNTQTTRARLGHISCCGTRLFWFLFELVSVPERLFIIASQHKEQTFAATSNTPVRRLAYKPQSVHAAINPFASFAFPSACLRSRVLPRQFRLNLSPHNMRNNGPPVRISQTHTYVSLVCVADVQQRRANRRLVRLRHCSIVRGQGQHRDPRPGRRRPLRGLQGQPHTQGHLYLWLGPEGR